MEMLLQKCVNQYQCLAQPNCVTNNVLTAFDILLFSKGSDLRHQSTTYEVICT